MTAYHEIGKWHAATYPNTDPLVIAAKLGEETGEVIGAMFRIHERRGDTVELYSNLADEIGDVLIVLSVIADRMNCGPLDEIRRQRFDVCQTPLSNQNDSRNANNSCK